MQRSESVRKVEIREEVTDLFNELEDELHQEFQDAAYNIMEEVENHYHEIALNTSAIPELMKQVRALLKDFPKQLLVYHQGTKSNTTSSPSKRLRFKNFLDTSHFIIEWAFISIEKLGVFVTGDSAGSIVTWNAKTLEPIKHQSLKYPIRTFAFDPAHDRLIVASDSDSTETPLQSFKISEHGLDMATAHVFECKEPVLTLLVLENERKLAIEDASWRIQVFDLDSLKYTIDVKVEGDAWFTRGDAMAYLPKSKLIAIPGADKQILPIIGKKKVQDAGTSSLRLYSLETGEMVKEQVINFKTVDKMLVVEDKLVLIDTHGAVIFVNAETLEETARLEFEDSQVHDAIYSKKLDMLICTTESPVVMLIKFSEAQVLRKLHPKAIRCEKSLIYLEEQEKLLVPFQVDDSDNISLGVLELGDRKSVV